MLIYTKLVLLFMVFSSHRRAHRTALSQRAAGDGGAGGREKSHFFAITLDPVHRIHTKFGMDILLDPWNKPAKEFFIFLKIQDGRSRHYGKL